MLLQLEHNTPEIYSEESRDFQLLCRILNIFLNALIEKTNKIVYDTSTDTLDENLLFLMARRLGFTTHKYFPATILKNICENFPYLINHKGTKDAIEKAAYTVLSANQDVVYLEVKMEPSLHSINIQSNASYEDLEYLNELLTFIVPAGVQWKYVSKLLSEVIYKGTIENLSGGGRAGRSRLRGIGESVSRIIKNSDWILKDPNLDPNSSAGYNEGHVPTRNWTNDLIPETPKPSFTKFHSKVNVARIVKENPGKNGVVLEFMNGTDGNPISIGPKSE